MRFSNDNENKNVLIAECFINQIDDSTIESSYTDKDFVEFDDIEEELDPNYEPEVSNNDSCSESEDDDMCENEIVNNST